MTSKPPKKTKTQYYIAKWKQDQSLFIGTKTKAFLFLLLKASPKPDGKCKLKMTTASKWIASKWIIMFSQNHSSMASFCTDSVLEAKAFIFFGSSRSDSGARINEMGLSRSLIASMWFFVCLASTQVPHTQINHNQNTNLISNSCKQCVQGFVFYIIPLFDMFGFSCGSDLINLLNDLERILCYVPVVSLGSVSLLSNSNVLSFWGKWNAWW